MDLSEFSKARSVLTNLHLSSQVHKEMIIPAIPLHEFEITEVHPLVKVRIDVPCFTCVAGKFR